MRRAALTMLSLRAARAFLRPAVRAPLRRAVVFSTTEPQQKPKKKKQQQQKKQQKVQKGAATQAESLAATRKSEVSGHAYFNFWLTRASNQHLINEWLPCMALLCAPLPFILPMLHQSFRHPSTCQKADLSMTPLGGAPVSYTHLTLPTILLV